MSSKEEPAVGSARLAKALSERDTWKASGFQEKYLEAYSLVEALELQLEQKARQVREAKPRDPEMMPASDNLLGGPKRPISERDLPDQVSQRARVMSELSIEFNGRYYHYHGYRYEMLSDAVNYARLERSRAHGRDSIRPGSADEVQRPPLKEVVAPGESDLTLMSSLGITFHNGIYLFGLYRYDHLVDAVCYAQLISKRGSTAVGT